MTPQQLVATSGWPVERPIVYGPAPTVALPSDPSRYCVYFHATTLSDFLLRPSTGVDFVGAWIRVSVATPFIATFALHGSIVCCSWIVQQATVPGTGRAFVAHVASSPLAPIAAAPRPDDVVNPNRGDRPVVVSASAAESETAILKGIIDRCRRDINQHR